MDREITSVPTDGRYIVIHRMHPGENQGTNNEGIAIVSRKEDNRLLVRKTFRETESNFSSEREWLEEMKMHRNLRHHNLCAFVEGSVTPELGRLYMEYCDRGNLYEFKANMNTMSNNIPASFAWHILKSLASALCYMHRGFRTTGEAMASELPIKPHWKCILHNDIKAGNVFLKSPDNSPHSPGSLPHVKLGDFGCTEYEEDVLARGAQESEEMITISQFPYWLANLEFSEHKDMFALGAVMQFLCDRDDGWGGPDPHAGLHPSYGSKLGQLVRGTMREDVAERLSSVQLTKLAYFAHRKVKPRPRLVPYNAYTYGMGSETLGITMSPIVSPHRSEFGEVRHFEEGGQFEEESQIDNESWIG